METLNIEYEPVIRKSLMDTIIDNIVEAVDYIKKDPSISTYIIPPGFNSNPDPTLPKIVFKSNAPGVISCNVVCRYSVIDIFRMHNVPTDNIDDELAAFDKVCEDIFSELQDRGVRVEPSSYRFNNVGYTTYKVRTNED